MSGKEDMVKGFLEDELLDAEVYSRLSERESNVEIKRLLERLSDTEKRHAEIWREILGEKGKGIGGPAFMGVKVLEMQAVRRLLGIAFLVKFLERHEKEGLVNYESSLRGRHFGNKEWKLIGSILGDEEGHERVLAGKAEKYKGDLNYIQSIIFGLNDGLVEILAVVAGLATVSTTSFIVVILGMIAGISGTLSMAGGAYLSAKSEDLVEKSLDNNTVSSGPSPRREAYYVGVWYFFGALLAVFPFLLGMKGTSGVLASILLVCAALTLVSSVIAVISGTSAKKRIFEMLAISLSAAFVTILFGFFAKLYFGVSV